MRCFAGTLTALALTILIATPALGQIDINAPVNIENVPNLEDLQDFQIENGQHLLTIQVPLYARDLHDDVEMVEVACLVHDRDEWVGLGKESRPYRGGPLRTTLSVPIEFDEGQEANAVNLDHYACIPSYQLTDGTVLSPHHGATDPRALLDESSTEAVGGNLNQVDF